MQNSVQLKFDGSFETFSPADGEALSKPTRHRDLMLDVDNNVWYLYHHRSYDPQAETGDNAYNVDKWKELS